MRPTTDLYTTSDLRSERVTERNPPVREDPAVVRPGSTSDELPLDFIAGPPGAAAVPSSEQAPRPEERLPWRPHTPLALKGIRPQWESSIVEPNDLSAEADAQAGLTVPPPVARRSPSAIFAVSQPAALRPAPAARPARRPAPAAARLSPPVATGRRTDTAADLEPAPPSAMAVFVRLAALVGVAYGAWYLLNS